jgi:hypothetical protein
MNLRRTIGLCVLACAAATAAAPDTVQTPAELLQALEEAGVVFDATNAARGALDGAVRAIDPWAEWVSGTNAADASATGAVATADTALRTAELWPQRIAYLRVRDLNAGSGGEITAHLAALADATGAILDLRGAAGSDLDGVARIASAFRCPGDAVFAVQDGRGREVRRVTAVPADPVPTELIVLVDRGTANAAELLAAVLKGRPGALVVGSSTRGDAGIRRLVPLPDGRFLRMAALRAALPDGSTFDGQGLQPDITVGAEDQLAPAPGTNGAASAELPVRRPLSAKSVEDRELMRLVADDPPLRRATDLLIGLRALGEAP